MFPPAGYSATIRANRYALTSGAPKPYLRIIVSRQENSLSSRILRHYCAQKPLLGKQLNGTLRLPLVSPSREIPEAETRHCPRPRKRSPPGCGQGRDGSRTRTPGGATLAPRSIRGSPNHRNRLWWNAFRSIHEELQGRVPGDGAPGQMRRLCPSLIGAGLGRARPPRPQRCAVGSEQSAAKGATATVVLPRRVLTRHRQPT